MERPESGYYSMRSMNVEAEPHEAEFDHVNHEMIATSNNLKTFFHLCLLMFVILGIVLAAQLFILLK